MRVGNLTVCGHSKLEFDGAPIDLTDQQKADLMREAIFEAHKAADIACTAAGRFRGKPVDIGCSPILCKVRKGEAGAADKHFACLEAQIMFYLYDKQPKSGDEALAALINIPDAPDDTKEALAAALSAEDKDVLKHLNDEEGTPDQTKDKPE